MRVVGGEGRAGFDDRRGRAVDEGQCDVAGQRRTTIENIAELVRGEPLSWLRAYVKHAADIPVVREVCEAAYGPIPATYVVADVCRDDLLVELEGALTAFR